MPINICHNCLKSYKGAPAKEVPAGSAYARKYCSICAGIHDAQQERNALRIKSGK